MVAEVACTQPQQQTWIVQEVQRHQHSPPDAGRVCPLRDHIRQTTNAGESKCCWQSALRAHCKHIGQCMQHCADAPFPRISLHECKHIGQCMQHCADAPFPRISLHESDIVCCWRQMETHCAGLSGGILQSLRRLHCLLGSHDTAVTVPAPGTLHCTERYAECIHTVAMNSHR